ncbi:MAG: hypothetical protein M1835_005811 [Candelina submexicana]|nr:MAG: hypothetical protein M1835_005811 [Candelina submexicana]
MAPTYGLSGRYLKYANHKIAELKEQCKERGLLVGGNKDQLIDRLRDSDDRIAAGDNAPPPKPKRGPRREPFPFTRLPPEIQMNVLDWVLAHNEPRCYEIPAGLPSSFFAPRIIPDMETSEVTDYGTSDSAQYEYILDPRKGTKTKPNPRRAFKNHILKRLRVSAQLSGLWLRCLNMVVTMRFFVDAPLVDSPTDTGINHDGLLLLQPIKSRPAFEEDDSPSSHTEVDIHASELGVPSPENIDLNDAQKKYRAAPVLISEHRRVELTFRGPSDPDEFESTGDCSVWSAAMTTQVDNLAHYVLLRAPKLQRLKIYSYALLRPYEATTKSRQTHFDPILKPLEGLRGLKKVKFPANNLFTDEYIEYFTKLVTTPAPKKPSRVQGERSSDLEEGTTLAGEDSALLEEGSTLVEEGLSIFGGGGVKKL